MVLTNSKITNILAVSLSIIQNRDVKGVENTFVEINLITTTIIFSIVDNKQNKARLKVTIYNDGEIACELSGDNDFNRLLVNPEHLHKANLIVDILEGAMVDYE